ncbi:MAG: hypothetical protein CVU56_28290 [Deltaproteobacteria bacterium HGW-Deltaproteobacteria-14]|nr:MAG: hypothetical protein CVU56_28290 [Deltaproteobacteria bacterium HGW-Deltaproteobacteria-14]
MTRFVSAVPAMAAVDARFAQGARLVTLVGAPGVGKTRVAREWVGQAVTRPEGWRCFCACDLAGATSEADVVAGVFGALTQLLGNDGAADAASFEGLISACRGAGPLLLVFDNLGGAVAPAAAVVARLLARCPHAAVLATSRSRLRLGGEHCVRVDPLEPGPALELFLDRARCSGADVDDLRETRRAVDLIISHVDGLPLALELAAANAALLPLQVLARRLAVGTTGLHFPFRDWPQRHQRLEAAIGESWALLSGWERRALAQLAVFEGGFSFVAATAVIDLARAEGPAPDGADALAALIARSLVHTSPSPEASPAVPRCRVLRPIRDYVWAQDTLDDEAREEARVRHARFFVALAEAGSAGRGETPRHVGEVLSAERANLWAAHRFLEVNEPEQAARLALAGQAELLPLGPLQVDRTLLDSALECARRADDDLLRARVLRARGVDHCRNARVDAGLADLEEGLALAERAGDRRLIAVLSIDLGHHAVFCGDPARALGHEERAQRLCESSGEAELLAKASLILGDALGELGRLTEARAALERGVAAVAGRGSYVEIESLVWIAFVDLAEGRDDRAARHADDADLLATDLGIARLALLTKMAMGVVAAARGDVDAARAALGPMAQEAAATGHHDYAAYGEIWRAALATRDGGEDVAAALQRAERMAPKTDLRCQEVLAHIRRVATGDAPTADASVLPPAASSLFQRIARRVVGDVDVPEADSTEGSAGVIRVGQGGAFFQVGDGERVSLGRRRRLRAILQLLAERRVASPGTVVTAVELFEAAWPGASLADGSGINRVYVVLFHLRSLGLDDYIIRTRSGYVLAPRTEFVYVPG